MSSVQTWAEDATESPHRDPSHPFSTAGQRADRPAAGAVTTMLGLLIDDRELEARFDACAWEFEAVSQQLDEALDAAFTRGDEEARADVHGVLFALYELHVAPAASERCANQFNPYLIRLRNAIERRWFACELQRTAPLDAAARSAEGLVEAIRAVSAGHRASHHPLFDFLEHDATRAQLAAFFRSDSALNVRFFDLIVLALLGSDPSVRGELAQNFWDEAGKGDARRSHVTLFRNLLLTAGIEHAADDHASLLEWQGLAGYNVFMMTGLNRSHGFRSLGVMAVTELLDPSQYEKLTRGCRRIGFGANGELDYYDEHVSIDVVHAEGWLANVIVPLARSFPAKMDDIYMGAQWRLNTCADYYDQLHAKLLKIV
ncbi:iron-containing redox enzyme family protein [Paraburkholderia acidicola]|nr:iron-containing redox enzyme family protein [Paraburkholderia acidicola]